MWFNTLALHQLALAFIWMHYATGFHKVPFFFLTIVSNKWLFTSTETICIFAEIADKRYVKFGHAAAVQVNKKQIGLQASAPRNQGLFSTSAKSLLNNISHTWSGNKFIPPTPPAPNWKGFIWDIWLYKQTLSFSHRNKIMSINRILCKGRWILGFSNWCLF